MKNGSVESRLREHYDLDLAIPRSITRNIQENRADLTLEKNNDTTQQISNSFSNIEACGIRLLCDDSISYERREAIALSLMTGERNVDVFEAMNPPDTQVSVFGYESSIISDVVRGPVRGELQQSNFLELLSKSALKNVRAPNMIVEEERRRLREMSSEGKELYTWAGTTLHSLHSVDRQIRSTAVESCAKKDVTISALTRKWKIESIAKAKAEKMDLSHELYRKKKSQLDTNDLRIKFMKNLTFFRKKLRERITERKDDTVISMMRAVNAKTADQFMERFEGCIMSVDEALAVLGSPLKVTSSASCVELPELLSFPPRVRRHPQCETEKAAQQERGIDIRHLGPLSLSEKHRRQLGSVQHTAQLQRKGGTAPSPVSVVGVAPLSPYLRAVSSVTGHREDSTGALRGFSSEQLDHLGKGTGNPQFDSVELELRRLNTLNDLRTHRPSTRPVQKRPLDRHQKHQPSPASECRLRPSFDVKKKRNVAIPKFAGRDRQYNDDDDDDTISTLSARDPSSSTLCSPLVVRSKVFSALQKPRYPTSQPQSPAGSKGGRGPGPGQGALSCPGDSNMQRAHMDLYYASPDMALVRWGSPLTGGDGQYAQRNSPREHTSQPTRHSKKGKPFFS